MLVAIVDVFLFLATLDLSAGATTPRHRWPQAIGFGLVAALAGAALVYAWGDRRRRSAAVGFLVGLLIACLVEGTCFFNP